MKKYYILAFTFLCLFIGSISYGQDWIEPNRLLGGGGAVVVPKTKPMAFDLNTVTVTAPSSSSGGSYDYTAMYNSLVAASHPTSNYSSNYGGDSGGGGASGDATSVVPPTVVTTPENIIKKPVITQVELHQLINEFLLKGFTIKTVVYAFEGADKKIHVGHLTMMYNPGTKVNTCYFLPITTDNLFNKGSFYQHPDPIGSPKTIYLGGRDSGTDPNYNSQLGITEYQYSYSNTTNTDIYSGDSSFGGSDFVGSGFGISSSGIIHKVSYSSYETNDMSGNYVYSGWNHWFEMAMKYHINDTTNWSNEVDILYDSGPNWYMGGDNLGLYGQRTDVENLMNINTLLNDSSITRDDLFPLIPFLIDKAKPYSADIVDYCKDIIELNRDPLENIDAYNPKIGVGAAPTPFYKKLIGHPGYYHWRTRDFLRRNPGKNPPDYYMEYGAKYINRFTNETSIVLSADGNKWLTEFRTNLQVAMEDKLQADKTIELGETTFNTFAFDSYVDSYLNNKNPDNTSLFSLNTVDLVAIVMTPDFNDLKSKEQIEKIVQKLSDYWASNPAEAEKRAAELLEKEDTIKLRIMEKALREDVDPSVALKTMNELLLDKIIPKKTVVLKSWYKDYDNDGYDGGTEDAENSQGTGWKEGKSKGTDCNDAIWSADNINCTAKKTWYLDNDGDDWYSQVKQAETNTDKKWKENLTSGIDCNDAKHSLTNDCSKADPCAELKNILNFNTLGDATKNLKAKFKDLDAVVSAPVNKKEEGFEITKNMDHDETYKYGFDKVTGGTELELPARTGKDIVGTIHSHPSTGVPIFSFQDLRHLLNLYNNAKASNKNDVFEGMVAKDAQGNTVVYALKVDDIAKLQIAVDAMWKHSDYASITDEKARIKAIHKKQAIKFDKSKGAIEKSFMQQMGSFGVDIYKASDSKLNTWNKLDLVTNPDATSSEKLIVTETSCN